MPVEIAIVVPMFNESANVAPLVDEIVRLFAAETRPWELVLVDDCSTDDTWPQIVAPRVMEFDSGVDGVPAGPAPCAGHVREAHRRSPLPRAEAGGSGSRCLGGNDGCQSSHCPVGPWLRQFATMTHP